VGVLEWSLKGNGMAEVKRVALAVCGGIAAYKAVEILRLLQNAGCSVRVAMTRNATEFITPLTFRAISGEEVVVDDFSLENHDPIAHITFSQTVDILIVAPATANTIAKFAHGIADDFVSTTYLAARAPVVIAPAMNTAMWEHPATRRNLQTLKGDGVHIISPDTGEMACGTFGPGRLGEPQRIVEFALKLIGSRREQDLKGERIVITAGATREEIDPVRFISNRSSGLMGFALAEAASARGAEVTLVAGATTAPEPQNIRLIRATSAEQMLEAVLTEIKSATSFISAAAVSDYRPQARAAQKLKKSAKNLVLDLEPTPDILKHVAENKNGSLITIGFAAETENAMENGIEKLKRKSLDAIVINDVTRDGAGFDTSTNIAAILSKDRDTPKELPLMSKAELSHHILDELVRLRKK
jgi:phosphopantothenoylcysteine decarboxylase / phosphopantothenate---cysteine ligase